MTLTLIEMRLPRRRSGETAMTDRRASARRRLKLARGFENVIHAAVTPRSGFSARVPVQREQVLAARADIEAVVARFRDLDQPLTARTLDLAHALLTDGSGPLYVWTPPGTLRQRVRMIRES